MHNSATFHPWNRWMSTPDSDVERSIANVDVQSLERHFQRMFSLSLNIHFIDIAAAAPTESIYNVPVGLETGTLESW